MALEESVDGLEKLESNGITAYIDPALKEFASGRGTINIDYVSYPGGRGGYMVTLGDQQGCSSGNCC